MAQDPLVHSHRMNYAPEEITPQGLQLKREAGEFRIQWKDGRESVFASVMLRKNCPCATCRTERETQVTELLPILKQAPVTDIGMVNARLVGTYAVQLTWSDGHDTGLFDFKYLRLLDDEQRRKA